MLNLSYDNSTLTSSNPCLALVALASVRAIKKKSESPMASRAAATLEANCRERAEEESEE
jgi:hypothetical protein